MTDPRPLRERIQDLLSRSEEERHHETEEGETRREELRQRRERFNALANRIYREILEPRLRLLEEYFDDCRYEPSKTPTCGKVIFNRDRRYAASFELEMGVSCDSQVNDLSVVHRLNIIPILMQFRSRDHLACPLEEVDQSRLTAFIDDRIVETVETYLDLQRHPKYRREKMVTDPVCGMVIHEVDAVASTVHDGTTYHFCAVRCQERFLEDPGKFVSGR